MSFRNTFVTSFIYQASEDVIDFNSDIKRVFEKYSRTLDHVVDERGYGYYAGVFSTLDGSIHDMGLPEIIRDLEKATNAPFTIAVLVESGPTLIYEISPHP